MAGLGTPSSAGIRDSTVAHTDSIDGTDRAAARRQSASISVLPQISQVGKRAARPGGASSVVATKFLPVREGRPVVLSRLAGTSWVKVAKTKLTAKGLAEFIVRTRTGEVPVTYRATALKYQGKAAVTTDEVASDWGTPDFVDEFSGSRLGKSWTHRAGEYNPKGLRRCAKGSRKAVRVARGAVQLSVLRDKSKGSKQCLAKRADGRPIGTFDYRLNGHISTSTTESFTYGVAAARMKFQQRRGQHASFWMQPLIVDRKAKTAAKGGAEIDIIEWFGDGGAGGGLTSFIYHPSRKGPVKVGDFIENPDQYLSSRSDRWWKKYHVFSVEWTPKVYIFRIDGHETFRTNQGISGQPQFPILSMLSSDYELEDLGGENFLPQHMYVDWVQFWETDTAER